MKNKNEKIIMIENVQYVEYIYNTYLHLFLDIFI